MYAKRKERAISGFAMKMRRSHQFRRVVGLLLTVWVSAAVSPGLVWCHESDGRINLEFSGCGCGSNPEAACRSLETLKSFLAGCGSCVDEPVFVMGLNEDFSDLFTGLIAHVTGIIPFLSLADSEVLSGSEAPPASDQISPPKLSIRTTVLLI